MLLHLSSNNYQSTFHHQLLFNHLKPSKTSYCWATTTTNMTTSWTTSTTTSRVTMMFKPSFFFFEICVFLLMIIGDEGYEFWFIVKHLSIKTQVLIVLSSFFLLFSSLHTYTQTHTHTHNHALSFYFIMIMFYLDQNLYSLSSPKRGRLLSLDSPLSSRWPNPTLDFDDYKGINYW